MVHRALSIGSRWFIYTYRAISPLWGTTVGCRFKMTCSEYALQVITNPEKLLTPDEQVTGIATLRLWFRIIRSIVYRIWSCNPFN